MKLTSFEIKNYKSIEQIKAANCPSLTIFVGRNSSGKTSIFETFKYLTYDNTASIDVQSLREKVHAGVNDFERKEISVDFRFEIPDCLRRDYLTQFLDIDKDVSEKMLSTQLLKKLHVRLSIIVPGSEVPQKDSDRKVLPFAVDISDSKGELYSLVHNFPWTNLPTPYLL